MHEKIFIFSKQKSFYYFFYYLSISISIQFNASIIEKKINTEIKKKIIHN